MAILESKRAEQSPLVSCGSHKSDSCSNCPQGHGKQWCNGDCQWDDEAGTCIDVENHVSPQYQDLLDLDLYAFQPVRDENGDYVNIMLVRAAFSTLEEQAAYELYKDDILFLGIMSYETFPFPSPNPYSVPFDRNEYLDKFPGWLNMVRMIIRCAVIGISSPALSFGFLFLITSIFRLFHFSL